MTNKGVYRLIWTGVEGDLGRRISAAWGPREAEDQECVWRMSVVAQRLRACPPDVPEHLSEVLALLIAGVTDEAASRQLAISPRTYARRVAEILSILGAKSRFQAGAVAAERGWLRAQHMPR